MARRGEIFQFDPSDGKVKSAKEIRKQYPDAPMVVTDEIPPTVSHATDEGLVFTSLTKLFEHYKEHGFECTGGDHLTGKSWMDSRPKSDPEDIRRDLAINLKAMKWGNLPLTEREKEICHREQMEWENYKKRQR